MSDVGVLSTINEFLESDKSSMPGNTLERKKSSNYDAPITIENVKEEIVREIDHAEPKEL